MNWHLKEHHFKSKNDAMGRAKKCHACLDCRHSQKETFKECPECGGQNRQYFMSETEFKRGMMLLTLQQAGTITKLKFQPRYALKVNGRKITTYIADAEYYEGEKLIVEDTKAPNTKFIDETSKIKIALFEAIYGVNVKIPQRVKVDRQKSGL